ncbi:hypothetical protein CHS0354_032933 [Potamilus streckersoni]|uniref:C2 Aida-type domain-containing protein n=1 Tax=Potamilus streckersoni TaxID=2493646 RepID=A0AAE0RWC5_9BIVA|nr:hypothetical protein CHS0354_032933 [Potamilus streckersoni]
MNDLEDEEKAIEFWHAAFKRGTDFDLWGQPVEAIDGYQRLSKHIQKYSTSDSLLFTDEQKRVLSKIAICLDLRCKALLHQGAIEGISLDDLKKIESTFKKLLNTRSKDFPVDVVAAQLQAQTAPTNQFYENEGDEQRERAKGSLLPKPIHFGGKSVLTIRIEKIGLKDATQYIDPHIQVSVKDSQGSDLTSLQDTPVAIAKEDNYVIFNMDVHIQKSIDSLPPGYAIFFEFQHYKPKKQTVSTRCWAFMEQDEIKDGPAVLELYKKPTNFKRKGLKLLTVKPLFLHLKLFLNT